MLHVLLYALIMAVLPAPSHQKDFNFEFGTWNAHLRRLTHPLSGSHDWVSYDGTSVLHPIWGGKGNAGELDVAGAAGRIEGFTVRLYDAKTDSWRVYYANSRTADLGTPLVGRFTGGRGEFFDRDTYNGKPIIVRFVFSNVTAHHFAFEQSFSPDNGKTWETNWIATFTR